jgi:Kelch motif
MQGIPRWVRGPFALAMIIALAVTVALLSFVLGSPTGRAAAGTWSYTGNNLQISRYALPATTLSDGRVLIEGGFAPGSYTTESEVYDPASNTWSVTGSMSTGRGEHTATLLSNGKVLVAGGYPQYNQPELYDPITGTWTSTGSMAQGRTRHTATLLPNGKVLVAGGWIGSYLSSAELYDPTTGTWSSAGNMANPRSDHIAVRLNNGTVLVAGGKNDSGQLAAAEIYNPITNAWSATGSMNLPRENLGAALLLNGKVLVMGGATQPPQTGFTATAELYDPMTGIWTQIASMSTNRFLNPWQQPVSLPDGTVLVIGGDSPSVGSTSSGTSEVYNPTTSMWGSISSMHEIHGGGATALLADGRPLIVAGNGFAGTSLTAELYGPVTPPPVTNSPTPVVTNSPTSSPSPTPTTPAPITATPVLPGPTCGTGLHIVVPAIQPWIDTGIDLVANDHVAICANGLSSISPGGKVVNPDGDSGGVPCIAPPDVFPAPNLSCWSLIGRIGGGTPFEVGTSVGFDVSTGGRLYLVMNDNYYPDNSGSWDAWVTITGPTVTTPAPTTPTPSPSPTPSPTPTVCGACGPPPSPGAVGGLVDLATRGGGNGGSGTTVLLAGLLLAFAATGAAVFGFRRASSR